MSINLWSWSDEFSPWLYRYERSDILIVFGVVIRDGETWRAAWHVYSGRPRRAYLNDDRHLVVNSEQFSSLDAAKNHIELAHIQTRAYQDVLADMDRTAISQIGLTTRTLNGLICEFNGDVSCYRLLEKTETELLRLPKFGPACLKDLKSRLRQHWGINRIGFTNLPENVESDK